MAFYILYSLKMPGIRGGHHFKKLIFTAHLLTTKRASLPADFHVVKGHFCVAQVTSFDPLKAGILGDFGRSRVLRPCVT